MNRKCIYITEYKENIFFEENCIYIIKGDISFNNTSISLKKNCILRFEDGIIRNGTLIGLHTIIDAPSYMQIFDNINIIGTWGNIEAYAEWWGAIGDGDTDDCLALNKAFQSTFIKIHLFNKHYAVYSYGNNADCIALSVINSKIIEGEVSNEIGTTIFTKGSLTFNNLCQLQSNGITISNVQFQGNNLVETLIYASDNSGKKFISHIQLINVRAFNCNKTCIKLVTFLSTLTNVYAGFSNIGISITGNEDTQIRGTSTLLKQCYVCYTKKIAYEIRLMSYCKLMLCCSDFNNSKFNDTEKYYVNDGYSYYIWGSDTISIDTCGCEMAYNSIYIDLGRSIKINNFSEWSSLDKTANKHITANQILIKNSFGLSLDDCFMGTYFSAAKTMTISNSQNISLNRILMRKPDGHMSDTFLSEDNCFINNSNVEF